MEDSLSNHEYEQNHFIPPFCSNNQCDCHQPNPDWKYKWAGWYTRKSNGLRYRRFQCRHCGVKFSTSSYQTTYWLHYPHLLGTIAGLSVSCACLRQIARQLEISHSTVGRYLSRLGRQCLLHQQSLVDKLEITESIAVDGFETFEYSQYFPCHFHLATGRNSWFLYHFTDSPLRRKGRMTDDQKVCRQQIEAQLGRPDPKAIEKDMAELIGIVVSKIPRDTPAKIHSDEHPAYPRAIKRLMQQKPKLQSVKHLTVSSTRARNSQNPLFTINHVDQMIRHSGSNHKRETIAYSKRRQRAAERLAIFMVYFNEIKWRKENGPPASAAMKLGLRNRLMIWKEILDRRLFPGIVKLRDRWWDYYRGNVKTAVFGDRQVTHRLGYAF